jgi:hypothetical protein
VKDENGDLLADSHNILNRRKNDFYQLLNAQRVSVVSQIGIHKTEPLVPDSSPFEVENSIVSLKRCTSPGSDQIPEELSQAGREMLSSEVHKLINSIWYKQDVPNQWNL